MKNEYLFTSFIILVLLFWKRPLKTHSSIFNNRRYLQPVSKQRNNFLPPCSHSLSTDNKSSFPHSSGQLQRKQRYNAQPFCWIWEQRPRPCAETAALARYRCRKRSTERRRWHLRCSGNGLGKLWWFSVVFNRCFDQRVKVCWQNSWLCCRHGNTLLFISFHCWHL